MTHIVKISYNCFDDEMEDRMPDLQPDETFLFVKLLANDDTPSRLDSRKTERRARAAEAMTEIIYHVGFLARDRASDKRALEKARYWMDQCEKGRCALVQRRVGKKCWEYIAQPMKGAA